MKPIKKRIAISQRYDQVPGRNEFRDALDARWAALFEQMSALPIVLPSGLSDVADYLQALEVDGLVLSGGNDIGTALQRDQLEQKSLDYAAQFAMPVLGVCRGMQFLNHVEGGELRTVEGHVARRHSLSGDWARGLSIRDVNSYHHQAIVAETLSPAFTALALSDDGVIEAMQHIQKPWLGIMWHPERETPFASHDLKLIQNHFGL